MNILILSTSPRKSFSTSLYFSRLLRLFLCGHNVQIIALKTMSDFNSALASLKDIDALVFASPVYVDTLPSTTLSYLKKLELHIKEQQYCFKVYAMLNCGFYEGKQCFPALNTYALWCKRAGLAWCGGIGIGSGVMLGFIRVLPFIGLGICAAELLVRSFILITGGAFSISSLFAGYFPLNFIIQTAVWFLFSMGAFVHIFALRNSVIKKCIRPLRYTTAWFCPRFLFVIMASLYWVFRALLLYAVMPWKLFQKNTSQ